MSWVRINPAHAHGRGASFITLAIRADKRHDVAKNRVFADFRIGPEAAESFGWKLGDKLHLDWGADEHAGFVRLEKSPSGRYTLRRKGKSRNESFTIQPVVPEWVTKASPAEACGEPSRDGAAMVLPLPARFKDLYQDFQRARDQGQKASLDPDQPVTMPATASQDARVSADVDGARGPASVTSVGSDSLPVRATASIAGGTGGGPGPLAQEMHPVCGGTGPEDTAPTMADVDEAFDAHLQKHGEDSAIEILTEHMEWSIPDDENSEWVMRPQKRTACIAALSAEQAPPVPSMAEIAAACRAYRGTPAQGRVIAARHGGDCAADVPSANRAAFIAELRSDKPETWAAPPRPNKPAKAPPWMRAEITFPKVVDLIATAAKAGEPAPTGLEIMAICGLTNEAQASVLTTAMETAGLIASERIHRGPIRRIFTICSTGAKTLDPRDLAEARPSKPITPEAPPATAGSAGYSAQPGAADGDPSHKPSSSAPTPANHTAGTGITLDAGDGRIAASQPDRAPPMLRISTTKEGGTNALTASKDGLELDHRAISVAGSPAQHGSGLNGGSRQHGVDTGPARNGKPAPVPPLKGSAPMFRPSAPRPVPVARPKSESDEERQKREFMEKVGVNRLAGHVERVMDADRAAEVLTARNKRVTQGRMYWTIDGKKVPAQQVVAYANAILQQEATVRVKPGEPVPFTSADKAAEFCRVHLKDKVLRCGEAWLLNGGAELSNAQLISRANRALTRQPEGVAAE